MKYYRLNNLRESLYFTSQDLEETLGIKLGSAQVLCSRYVKKGIFIRLKNNFYIFDDKFKYFTKEDFFKIGNFLQVPSYISFVTALSYYGVTTQVLRNFYDSASLKRSVDFTIKGAVYNYYKLNKDYYFGFERRNGIFIATKEKAFVDSVYLYSFGKYKLDFAALNLDVLDKGDVLKIAAPFPQKTVNLVKKLCKI